MTSPRREKRRRTRANGVGTHKLSASVLKEIDAKLIRLGLDPVALDQDALPLNLYFVRPPIGV
jgi:hypothetical protein